MSVALASAEGTATEIAFDLSFDLVRRIQVESRGEIRHTYVSPSFLTVLGHEPADLLGDCHKLDQLFPPQILERLETLAQAVRAGKVVTGTVVQYPFLHKDGHEVFFEHRLCLSHERPMAELIAISRDISERLERTRLVEELAAAKLREERLRADAYRMINHTSKRSMSNTVAMCDVIRKLLDRANYQDADDDLRNGSDVRSLLAASRAESIAGINLCRSALVHANVLSGHHTSQLETFSIQELFERLGWCEHGRYRINGNDCLQCHVHADASALQAVLFNAGMNALQHGAHRGIIHVSVTLQPAAATLQPAAAALQPATAALHPATAYAGGAASNLPSCGTGSCMLCISIRSAAGSNHKALVEAVGEDTDVITHLLAHPASRSLVGGKGSTFCGLADIRTIVNTVFVPCTTVGLYCRGEHAVFELTCPIQLVEPAHAPCAAPAAGSAVAPNEPCHPPSLSLLPASVAAEAPSPLPAGLVWVCVDDDAISRFLAQQAFGLARADHRSRVVGETYEEVASVVAQVTQLGSEAGGSSKLVLCLDQHLDFEEGSFLGTELCTALRTQHAFGGVIIILSANDDDDAIEEYRAAGADASLGKGVVMRGKTMAETLVAVTAKAYAARAGTS